MKNDKEFKKELIEYIKANGKNYSNEYLDNCSVTSLTIIKTEIEIRRHFSKKKN